MAKRILICGGRDFGNMQGVEQGTSLYEERKKQYQFILSYLDSLFPVDEEDESSWLPPSGTCIISGKATGADSAGADWAILNYTLLEEYPADWKKYGKRAGFIRNTQMLNEGKPDLVIAFPGGRGTAMMVRLALMAGVEVIEVPYDG